PQEYLTSPPNNPLHSHFELRRALCGEETALARRSMRRGKLLMHALQKRLFCLDAPPQQSSARSTLEERNRFVSMVLRAEAVFILLFAAQKIEFVCAVFFNRVAEYSGEETGADAPAHQLRLEAADEERV